MRAVFVALAIVLAMAACHGRRSPLLEAQRHPRAHLTAKEWLKSCGDRIELARLALVRLEPAFNDTKVELDDAPWNPRIHFETRTGENGLWWGTVARGEHPCAEDHQRGFTDWRDGTAEFPMMVDRQMRIGGDVAWLQADHVNENTAIAFRREMQ